MRGAALIAAILVLFAAEARANTLEVCSTCAYTTIGDALGAAQSGDSVEVGAGVWVECALEVPPGVTLSGGGRAETTIDASACANPTALVLGAAAAATDLGLRAEPTAGTGVVFLDSGSVDRIDVRGGSVGLATLPGNSAQIDVSRTLIALDGNGSFGVAAVQADWSLAHVTLVQTSGQSGAAVHASIAAGLTLRESLVVGWSSGVLGPSSGCSLRRVWFWDTDGDDWADCEEDIGLPNHTEVDPLFVNPAEPLTGDFHLQSTAGEWDGAAFPPGSGQSPAVDAAHHDTARELAEFDQPCNLPNLGAYGGTIEASRSWQTECPVTDTTNGQGYASLVDAAAALSESDHVLTIRDGEVDAGEDAEFVVGATVEAAVGATPRLSSLGDIVRMRTPSSSDESFVLRGLTLVAGGYSIWPNAPGTTSVLIQDVFQEVGMVARIGSASPSVSSATVAITVLDSVLGTRESPLFPEPFWFQAQLGGFELSLIGVEAHSTFDLVRMQVIDGCSAGCAINLFQSWIESEADGIDMRGTQGNLTLDVSIEASVVVADGSGVHASGSSWNDGSFTASNSIFFSESLFGAEIPQGVDGSVTNSLFLGDHYCLEYHSASSFFVQNSLFGNCTVAIRAENGDPSPFTIQNNGFWDNGTDAYFALDATNHSPCDPGIPTPTWPIDPVDYIPAPGGCGEDLGNPLPAYTDADLTRNDLGPTGGPGGPDFLALFDLDGDGHAGDFDCDDSDPLIYVGAPDGCDDGTDYDCSGEDGPDADTDGYHDVDCGGTDCDDSDPSINAEATDVSCDGIDQDCSGDDELDADGDGVDCDTDCVDTAASVYPGAPAELCDGYDTDCDGSLGGSEGDDDGDGWLLCTGAPDLSPGILGGGDCADTALTVNPGAAELCDGWDTDCDGSLDPDELDTDGDGYLICDAAAVLDVGLVGGGDCDDFSSAAYPGHPELCDGLDNDCDGLSEDGSSDSDGDGEAICDGDCDDTDASVNTSASEDCDGVDTDCDGTTPTDELDLDSDGYVPCSPWVGDSSAAGGDCNDQDASYSPAAPSACDGVDRECDGDVADETDDDGDGWAECDGDCDDAEPATYPFAPELCDGLDNECDGVPDNPPDGDGDNQVCDDDCDDGDGLSYAGAPELCDGVDNDCDGSPDPGEVDLDGDGVLACEPDCNDSDPLVSPVATELCDGLDNDCSGAPDPDEVDLDGDGSLACADCDDDNAARSPTAVEVCDGEDNDCDFAVAATETDDDGDGFVECEPWVGVAGLSGGDCDDEDELIHPAAIEVCDGVDNDCIDGIDDEDPSVDDPVTWWPDVDGDGFGDVLSTAVVACSAPADHVANNGDCDDDHDGVHPDIAPDYCDGRDSDCDGKIGPEESDVDGDGYLDCLPAADTSLADGILGGDDCRDDDPARAPGLPEECDGEDNDCDDELPADELDNDADGQAPCDGDCGDGDRLVYRDAPELCDAVDNDCDGEPEPDEVDADGDGWLACEPDEVLLTDHAGAGDCDDGDPAVNPAADEVCSGVDDDCDGVGDPPGCLPVPMAGPGCTVSCSSAGEPGWFGLLLLLAWRRRR